MTDSRVIVMMASITVMAAAVIIVLPGYGSYISSSSTRIGMVVMLEAVAIETPVFVAATAVVAGV